MLGLPGVVDTVSIESLAMREVADAGAVDAGIYAVEVATDGVRLSLILTDPMGSDQVE